MKKFFLFAFTIFSITLLTACGNGFAKVTGIRAAIVKYDSDIDVSSEECVDNDTLADNDYLATVEEKYWLVVDYTYYGGSRAPVFSDDSGIEILYDDDIFSIDEPIVERGILHYTLVCKKSCHYSSILIELDGLHHTEITVSTVSEYGV